MSFFFFFRPVFIPAQLDTDLPYLPPKPAKKRKRKVYEVITRGGLRNAEPTFPALEGMAKGFIEAIRKKEDEEILQLIVLLEDT